MSLIRISLRFLFSKKRFSYTNISIYLSIISFTLSIAIALLVISISRGYETDLKKKIQSIEPDAVITSKFGDFIDKKNIDKIKNQLTFLDSTIHITAYIEKYAMSKNSQ